MEMEIKLKCMEKSNIELVLSNDFSEGEPVQHIFIQVQPCNQEAWVCVSIEKLKLALRKLSAK